MLRADSVDCRTHWRVSTGTAAVLGLAALRMDTAPTTAYLMLGERCANDCAFCAQAATSASPVAALSRVAWPLYPANRVVPALAGAHAGGAIRRVCFQVTGGLGAVERARDALGMLHATVEAPVCVSIAARTPGDVTALLEAGAQRVTIALDAATPGLYALLKGDDWSRTWDVLIAAARRHPGRIGTHLIAGLGETEEQLLTTAHALLRLGITVGLFAFTPVPGTRLAGEPPPSLAAYRRAQAGFWLMREGLQPFEEIRFDAAGRVADYGVANGALAVLLRTGDAFRTAGCPDCNRPYFNERPGGPLYNHARPLDADEASREIDALIRSLPA